MAAAGSSAAAAAAAAVTVSSTALFEYDCEAVRVRVKRLCKNGQEEQRTFSIDPNLTSYDILKSILSRAYDIVDEFVIYFSSSSTGSPEDWLPLLSDWDLDVAILSAADPYLVLMITERKLKTLELPPASSDAPGLSSAAGMESPSSSGIGTAGATTTSVVTLCSSSTTSSAGSGQAATVNTPQFGLGGGSSGASVFNSLRQQVEKSLPSLTNRLQKAFTVAEDTILPKSQQVLSMLESGCQQDGEQLTMSEKEFRTFLNKVGEVIKPREMRLSVYQAGAEPQLRKVLWKHLLGVYPPGLTGKERVDYIKVKVGEYEQLKQTWMSLILQGRVTDDLKYITNMVKKDVLRTDRHLAFYSGEGNANVTVLYNILTTFALNHPTVGYCQVGNSRAFIAYLI